MTKGLLALPELPNRADRLAKDVFRMPPHDVVIQFSHRLVAESLVQCLRPRVEGRDAEEDVRRLAEDPLLGEPHQAGSDPPAPVLLADANRLDVTDERPRHVQDHETEHAALVERPVHLARRVLQQGERLLVSTFERDPRFGDGHHPRALARLLRRRERTDVEGGQRRLFDDREDLPVPALTEGSHARVPGAPFLVTHDLLARALVVRQRLDGVLEYERVEGTDDVGQDPGLLHRHPEPLKKRASILPDRERLTRFPELQLKDVPNHDHESLLLLPDFFTLRTALRCTPRARPIGSRAQKMKSVAGGS